MFLSFDSAMLVKVAIQYCTFSCSNIDGTLFLQCCDKVMLCNIVGMLCVCWEIRYEIPV